MDDDSPVSRLTEEEVSEIRRAFAVFDRDGSGTIDSKELADVVKGFGVTLSEFEVQALRRRLDRNMDGFITQDEFLEGMAAWLGEEQKLDSPDTHNLKRKEPMARKEARKEVHRKIARFFLQFQKPENFEEIWRALQQRGGSSSSGFGLGSTGLYTMANRFHGDVYSHLHVLAGDVVDSAQKTEEMKRIRQLLSNLHAWSAVVRAEFSTDAQQALEGTVFVAEILSKVHVLRNPLERCEFAEDLKLIFQRIEEAKVIPRFVQFLELFDFPNLQREAARAISYFAPGPRIPNTPLDSPFHPDKMLHKIIVMRAGAIPLLIHLLDRGREDVGEQALLALGALAAHNPECRDYILQVDAFVRPSDIDVLWLQARGFIKSPFSPEDIWYHPFFRRSFPLEERFAEHFNIGGANSDDWEKLTAMHNLLCALYTSLWRSEGALQHMLNLLNHSSIEKVSLLRKVTWVLSVLAGDTHPETHPPPKELIFPAISEMARFLLVMDDEEVLVNVIVAMQHLLPFTEGTGPTAVSKRLIELLRHPKPRVEYASLSTLRQLIATSFVSVADIDGFHVFFTSDSRHHHHFVITYDIIPALVSLLVSPYKPVRLEACKTIRTIVERGHTQVIFQANLVAALIMLVYDEDVSFDTVRVLKHLSAGTSTEVRELVANGLVEAFCDALKFFRVSDEVLSDVYGFSEVSYDFDLARDALDGIKNILNMGETDRSDLLTNRYLQFFGVSVLNKIGSLITEIRKAPTSLNSWRNLGPGEARLEDRVRDILVHVKKAHESTATLASGEMVGRINEFFALYFSEEPAAPMDVYADKREIGFRLVIGDNPYLIRLSRGIQLSDLVHMLEKKYGAVGKIEELTKTGERREIVSQAALEAAIEHTGIDELVHLIIGITKQNPGVEGIIGLEKSKLTQELSSLTHFGSAELDSLLEAWKGKAVDGTIDLATFDMILRSMGVKDDDLIKTNFNAFDENRDGKIELREFACGLSVLLRGSDEERLHFTFKACDTDNSGFLDKDEVYKIFKSALAARGLTLDSEILRAMVDQGFSVIDLNHDEKISYEEFKQAVLKHQLVINFFWKAPLGIAMW